MRKVLSYMRRAVDDYHMICEGDNVTVGVSGGKDSLTLLCAMKALSGFYPEKFQVSAVSIDMGFENMSFEEIKKLCCRLDVHYEIVKTDIREIIFDIRKEKNPCSLCAKMRRGALNDAAKKMGSDVVALGHHFDDVVETFVMNQLFEGRAGCFSPVTYLDRMGVRVIRPMIYMPENYVRIFAKKNGLPVVKSRCEADGNTMREYTKNLIFTLDKEYPGLKQRLFTALCGSGLDGWKRPGIHGKPRE